MKREEISSVKGVKVAAGGEWGMERGVIIKEEPGR